MRHLQPRLSFFLPFVLPRAYSQIRVIHRSIIDTARSLKIRRPEFMSLLWVSPNRIIRRQCSSCEGKFKDVYYKRMTEEGLERKIIVMMIGGEDRYGFHESDCGDYENCPVKNKCNVDFKLYSSYKDAVDEVNAWEHCVTVDYGSGNDMYSSSVNIVSNMSNEFKGCISFVFSNG